MSFKVGDKVKLKEGSYLPRRSSVYFNNREFANIYGLKEDEVYEIADYNELNNVIVLKENYLCFLADRFEKVEEPPEIKVGDVWASESKNFVVKVLAKFQKFGGECISFIHLKGEEKGKAAYLKAESFPKGYSLLLHREPPKQKKQPKPQQPKKEEKWESVFQSNDVFRCGNKIKVVVNGFEGYAECNKNDKFDLMFGVNLAAHRATVKYHQWVIEKMLKEGAK